MGFFDFIGDAVSGVEDAASSFLSSGVGSVVADVLGGPAGFFLTPQGSGVAHALTGALGIPDPFYGGLNKKQALPKKGPAPKAAQRKPLPLPRKAPRGKAAIRPAARQTVTLRQNIAPVRSGLSSLAAIARRGAPQATTPAAQPTQAAVIAAIKKGLQGKGLSAQENAIFSSWKANTAQGRSYVAQQQAAIKAKIAASGFVGPGHAPPQRTLDLIDRLSGPGGGSGGNPFGGGDFVGPGGPPRGMLDNGGPVTIFDSGGGGAPVGDSGPRLGGGQVLLDNGNIAYIPKAAGARVSLDAFDLGGSNDAVPFDQLARPEAGRPSRKRNAAAQHSATWREKRRRQRRRRRQLPLDGGFLNTHPAIPVRRRN